MLDRLAALPWLSEVTLQTTTRQTDGTIQFSVAASLSNEGPQMIKKLDTKLALLLTVVAALRRPAGRLVRVGLDGAVEGVDRRNADLGEARSADGRERAHLEHVEGCG